jgi:hypothetical protein
VIGKGKFLVDSIFKIIDCKINTIGKVDQEFYFKTKKIQCRRQVSKISVLEIADSSVEEEDL